MACHAGAVTNRGPGSNTAVRPLAEPVLYGLQGRASVDRPSSPAVLWSDGNQWKSSGAQRPKQTDVRINIAKEQPRFELLPYGPRTAGTILRSAASSKTSKFRGVAGEGQS